MLQLLLESFIVGILIVIVGFVISYISMGNDAKDFQHWNQLLLTFFISGFEKILLTFTYPFFSKFFFKIIIVL